MVNKITGSLLSLVIISVSSYTYAFTPKKVTIPAKDIKEVEPISSEFSSPNYVTYSPDGTKILYTRVLDYVSGVIIFKDLITGSSTCLTEPYEIDTPADGDAQEPDFSPDGTKIVFTLKTELPKGKAQIWKMDIDGQNKVKLTSENDDCESPKWSPDGSKILFICYNNLYTIDPQGNNKKLIYDPPQYGIIGACWSPDGNKIAFGKVEEKGSNIYIIDAEGTTEPVQLTFAEYYCTDPAWSPDGSKIIYDSSKGLIIINAVDGSNPTELVLPNGLGGNCPDWSPNGKEIIFVGVKDITGPYEMPKSAAGIYILTLPKELQCPPKKKMRKGEGEKVGKGEVFEAKRPKGGIVIDGMLREWVDVKKVAINKKEYVTYNPSNWQGKDDLSAIAMVQGDDKNLYLAIGVKDDNFVQPFTGDNILKGDHLELWFETPKGIYQLGISPGDFKQIKPEVVLWLPRVPTKNKQQILKGIEVASKKRKKDYTIEAKIPLAPLGISSIFNDSIGFTIALSDTDNREKPRQKCLLASSELRWNKPRTFGELIFKYASTSLFVPEGWFGNDIAELNLDKDEEDELLMMIGRYNEDAGVVEENRLFILDLKDKEYTKVWECENIFYGWNVSWSLENINKDGIKELFISDYSGGSGSSMGIWIFAMNSLNPKILFEGQGESISTLEDLNNDGIKELVIKYRFDTGVFLGNAGTPYWYDIYKWDGSGNIIGVKSHFGIRRE
ncbi:MAG: DPP IV N-terminal domain-containing protein [bacterium]